MERMLIKHLSGSKANQVEEFSLKHHNELIFGREAGLTVKYDPDRDDLVGRQHAKIARDPADPNGFQLTDLNSTNGTFLNGQKVTDTRRRWICATFTTPAIATSGRFPCPPTAA